jgi:hypothetical protein
MPVRRLVAAACLGAVATTIAIIGPPQQTLAAWQEYERGSSSVFAAGIVNPPGTVTCANVGLTGVRYTWPAATGGIAQSPVSYHWEIVGTSASGTTSTTSADVAIGLGIGTYTFSVHQTGPGGWISAARTSPYRILLVIGRC